MSIAARALAAFVSTLLVGLFIAGPAHAGGFAGELVRPAPQAKAVADGLAGTDKEKLNQLYRRVMQRSPNSEETKLATEFLKQGNWTQLAHTVLASNEFLFVD